MKKNKWNVPHEAIKAFVDKVTSQTAEQHRELLRKLREKPSK